MTVQEGKDMKGLVRMVKWFVFGGGGSTILFVIAFYFNTENGIAQNTEHIKVQEETIEEFSNVERRTTILEQQLTAANKANVVFIENYKEDRDEIKDLLKAILKEQKSN